MGQGLTDVAVQVFQIMKAAGGKLCIANIASRSTYCKLAEDWVFTDH